MNVSDIGVLERACEALYTTTDTNVRQQAESVTAVPMPPTEASMTQLLTLWEGSSNGYVNLWLCHTFRRITEECWDSNTSAMMLRIRATAHAVLLKMVSVPALCTKVLVTDVARVYALSTKRLWFDARDLFSCLSCLSMRRFRQNGNGDDMSVTPFEDEDSSDPRTCMGLTATLFADFYKFVPRGYESVSPSALSLGLTLLQNVVETFSHYLTGSAASNQVSSLTQRFCALAFRSTALTDVLQTAYDLLKRFAKSITQARNECVQLIWLCLSYDFEGTGKMGLAAKSYPYATFYGRSYIRVDELESEPDDLHSDVGQIPFPKSWERFFQPGSLMEELLRNYFEDPMCETSAVTLECILQMVCVRRDVFERYDDIDKWFNILTNGLMTILKNSTGLTKQENHHMVCRILGQLASAGFMIRLASSASWPELGQLLLNFTLASIKASRWCENSVPYLITFWSHMSRRTMPGRCVTDAVSKSVGDSVKVVYSAYIQSKLADSVALVRDPSLNNPLLNIDSALEQVSSTSVGFLSRRSAEDSVSALVQSFEQLLAMITAARQEMATTNEQFLILLYQLSWVLYFAAAHFDQRRDVNDARLVAYILKVIFLYCGGGPDGAGPLQLERNVEAHTAFGLALVNACSTLHQVIFCSYGSEDGTPFSQLLVSLVGEKLASKPTILEMLLTEIRVSLRGAPTVASAAVELLAQFSESRTTIDLLRESSVINSLLPFLLQPDPRVRGDSESMTSFLANYGVLATADKRARASFFSAVSKVIIPQLQSYDRQSCQWAIDSAMDTLLGPIGLVVAAVEKEIAQGPVQQTYQVLAGLFRDMSGILVGSTVPSVMQSFFEWFYPTHGNLLYFGARCCVPSTNPECFRLVVETLSFVSDLMNGDKQAGSRVVLFDCTCGIHVIKLVLNVIATYAPAIATLLDPATLATNPRKGEISGMVLRAAKLYLRIAARLFSYSCWRNVAVFEVFGDSSLKDGLISAFKFLFSLAERDIMENPKLADAALQCLACQCSLFSDYLAALLTPEIFVKYRGILMTAFMAPAEGTSLIVSGCAALGSLLEAMLNAQHIAAKQTHVTRPLQAERVNKWLLLQKFFTPDVLADFSQVLLRISVFYNDDKILSETTEPLLFAYCLLPPGAFEQAMTPMVASWQPNDRNLSEILLNEFHTMCESAAAIRDFTAKELAVTQFRALLSAFRNAVDNTAQHS